jgi:hypothetical protein
MFWHAKHVHDLNFISLKISEIFKHMSINTETVLRKFSGGSTYHSHAAANTYHYKKAEFITAKVSLKMKWK